jgi:DNA ligase-1
MERFAQLCESIAHTSSRNAKIALVAEYLRSVSLAEAAIAAVFLSGRPFPAYEQATLQVGGALLWRAVSEISGATSEQMNTAYRRHGDLGSAAADLLQQRRSTAITLEELERTFRALAGSTGAGARFDAIKALLERTSPLEAKYAIKIMGGDLRIGLRDSLVEEAIAKAFKTDAVKARRANMMLGDIGQTLRLAAEKKLDEAQMRLFHPLGMMLASPVESAQEALECFDDAAVEDKYDGIRAQVHCDGDRARIFSRTLDDISGSFPELPPALLAIDEGVVLDGEIVAWNQTEQRALPFAQLQKRLGRKLVSAELVREVPVAFVAFDVLFANGELVIARSLRERKKILRAIFERVKPERGANYLPEERSRAQSKQQMGLAFLPQEQGVRATILQAPVWEAQSAVELDSLFERAQERGNEGLMIKDWTSEYVPGRRGKTWLKLKRELATLDVVVTSVEFGHGKRAGVLSDYTFAVRNGGGLVNIGKAYSGLTDAEIAEMTAWFKEHTIVDHGHWREVEPKVVLEVAFNNMMRSERHESGLALRFPRIVRLRWDKSADEADTLGRAREIFERQHKRAA